VGAIKPLVAGNWKMNGLAASLGELKTLKEQVAQGPIPEADIMVCPPATLLAQARYFLTGSAIQLGAQDCHTEPSGAHTGDLSAEMLADAGARAVIVGHSERRSDHGETDALVNAKARAAYRAKIAAIICIGETEQERRDGTTLQVVRRQLEGSLPSAARASNTIIAYEPVWAIGTGLTPTPADVAEVHGFIRGELGRLLGESEAKGVRILYGGSVKSDNASELLLVPDVDGALVGGASLKAADFYAIASVYAGR
jgi:triosephosphate isomerase